MTYNVFGGTLNLAVSIYLCNECMVSPCIYLLTYLLIAVLNHALSLTVQFVIVSSSSLA